jgi:DUF1680 family protein
MMQKAFLVVSTAFILAVNSPLFAGDLIKGCFERVYDQQHIAKHKGQTVRAMQLQIGMAQGKAEADLSENDMDSLAVRFVKNTKLYYSGATCSGNQDEASCSDNATATRFSVQRTGRSVKITFNTPVHVVAEGEPDITKTIPRDTENSIYALVKVSDNNCEYFNR